MWMAFRGVELWFDGFHPCLSEALLDTPSEMNPLGLGEHGLLMADRA